MEYNILFAGNEQDKFRRREQTQGQRHPVDIHAARQGGSAVQVQFQDERRRREEDDDFRGVAEHDHLAAAEQPTEHGDHRRRRDDAQQLEPHHEHPAERHPNEARGETTAHREREETDGDGDEQAEAEGGEGGVPAGRR